MNLTDSSKQNSNEANDTNDANKPVIICGFRTIRPIRVKVLPARKESRYHESH